MIDPKKELRDYLDKLIHQFLFITRMNDELLVFDDWITRPDGIQTLEIGASFFNLVQKTFYRTILIEICKLVDDREQISLVNWLNEARKFANRIKPTIFNPHLGMREIVTVEKYREIVDSHLKLLNKQYNVINNLKARRDKVLAHTDSEFFNDPQKHFQKYPLIKEDITGLLLTISYILRKQGVHILRADIGMRVHTINNLERILQFIRGFERAQKDNNLHAKGIYIMNYKWDEVRKM